VNANRREDLDQAEGLGRGYLAESLTIYPSKGETSDTGMSCSTKDAVLKDVLVYVADAGHKDKSMQPYDWYKGYVLTGAQEHKLPADYVSRIASVKSQPDPRPDSRTHKAASQAATVDSSKLAESTGAANAKQDQQQAALKKRDETGASLDFSNVSSASGSRIRKS
jgi:hypothetical protein